MPTTAEIQENAKWLKDQDYSVDLIYKPAKMVQWYRADGAALPNLLPCDPYHIRQFRKKGWTLKPPAGTVPDWKPAKVEAPKATEPAPLYVSDKPKRTRPNRTAQARNRAQIAQGVTI